jgi:glycosyltransferase involved in cell wall biosynthesis
MQEMQHDVRDRRPSHPPRPELRVDPRRALRVGLHVGQLFQAVPGGLGRVTGLLCERLPVAVDLVAFGAAPRAARQALASRLGPEVELHGTALRVPSWQYEVWHRLRRPRVRLDLDVCHAPSLAVPPAAAPLVVSVNDVAFLRHPETFSPHGVRFHERGLELARRHAAAVIAPSRHVAEELVREGFDRSRIHHVPLGVAPVAHPTPAEDRETRAIVDALGVTGSYVLTVGTVEPRKRHAVLADALGRVRAARPGAVLVVAGPQGWIADGAAAALDRPGVVRLGAVTDRELDALYRHADVVAAASIAEGFGLTVLEAMARGRAVTASDIPVHAELLGGAGVLVPPDDVDATADALLELLDRPAHRDALGRAARRRAADFDAAQTVSGHVAVYRTVAER